MKIYTKTGDQGTTGLFGGARVPKHHIRIESYGTVDELNSYIGLIRHRDIDKHYADVLGEVQDRLFTIGSILASDPSKSNLKVPDLHLSDIEFLEKEIDVMNEALPAVLLNEKEPIEPLVIIYLNRLSDHLFVLGRKLSQDTGAVEVPWKPRQ